MFHWWNKFDENEVVADDRCHFSHPFFWDVIHHTRTFSATVVLQSKHFENFFPWALGFTFGEGGRLCWGGLGVLSLIPSGCDWGFSSLIGKESERSLAHPLG